MATGNRTLKLSILADVDDLKKKLGEADKSVESNSKKISDFGKKAALAFAAVGAAAVVFGKKAIDAGERLATANARIAQINKSMNLFGDSTDEVTKRLISYAEATARSTGVDTNSIKITQAKLLTFKELAKSAGELGGEFDRATKAAIDLAAAGFGSAEENAVQLGKALQDPIKGLTALGRSGVTFTEVEKERIRTLVESNRVSEAQILILQAIETQVGGTAEATANASEKIRVGFDQVQEKIGLALLPTFEKFSNYLLETAIPIIESFINGITNVGLSADEASIKAFEFGERVRSILKFIISIKDELLILGGIIATVFVANKIVAFVTAIMTLVTAMKALRTAAAGAAVATAFATGGASVGTAAAALAAVAATYGLSKLAGGKDIGGNPAGNYPSSPSNFTYGAGNPAVTNIYVSAIDGEGAARAVAKTLNAQSARSVSALRDRVN